MVPRAPTVVRSITFNLGLENQFDRTVKWEQSENLVMKNEVVDLSGFRRAAAWH